MATTLAGCFVAMSVTASAASAASPIALTSGVPVTATVFEGDGTSSGVVTLLNDSAWFTFSALAGTPLTVSAENARDTAIELYVGDVTRLDFGSRDADYGSQNATPELTFVGLDDDGGSGRDSRLSLSAPTTGVYSLLVTDLFETSIQTTVTATYTPATVPLPAPAGMLLAGLGGLALLRRRRA